MRPSRTAIDGLEEWDVVYTDGACSNNGKVGAVAGIGVWWGHDHPSNISERCPGDQTNNRAELIALIRVLESTPIGTRPLLIKTDSQYSMNCVNTWLPGWERNNWRSANGNPVKNKPLIQYLSVLLRARHHFKQKVELAYVKGHSGDEGNDGADGLAVAGTREAVRPDRDWDGDRKKLEEQMEKGGIPVTIGNGAAPMPAIAAPPAMKKSTVVVDDAMDLDFYADGLLDDDDLERDLADL
ncbi:hypothetical protein JAAARDRAFT_588769 [Jaapia argillacea MUCL 33604]|uniref:ribonuclease H n=1 Tax=Jaapia argillacea MUCL 33604 TaxID=933084 RepID=A0A067P8T5_9AGAM|nr:hypothetical protein JAAARDRAFT_588769 [Jaapia argillacea MUCL 33604]